MEWPAPTRKQSGFTKVYHHTHVHHPTHMYTYVHACASPYQGWAIRGWNDAAGASRIRALYDAVPKGQWVALDMDISGIWKYFGNYSFFGAPFIWTYAVRVSNPPAYILHLLLPCVL